MIREGKQEEKTVLDENASIYKKRNDENGVKLKDLHGSEKKQYFMDYYLKKIIVGVLIGALAISVLISIFGPRTETLEYTVILNNPFDTELLKSMYDDMGERLIENPKKEQIIIDNNYYVVADEYGVRTKLLALTAAAEIDTMIMNESEMTYQVDSEVLMDLRTLLPADMQEALKDYFIYSIPRNEEYTTGEVEYGVEGVYALDITPFFEAKDKPYGRERYTVGVVVNTEHPEGAVEFIRYLYGMPCEYAKGD